MCVSALSASNSSSLVNGTARLALLSITNLSVLTLQPVAPFYANQNNGLLACCVTSCKLRSGSEANQLLEELGNKSLKSGHLRLILRTIFANCG